jgi:hypothetical protein
MTRCILHLGSEKTGTSSIQRYFGTHRQALLNEGIWYPKSFTNPAGFVHLRLSDAAADGTLDKAGFSAADFREEYATVRSGGFKTCVFSSEFFHSHLRDQGSVERLHAFLAAYFDDIALVYYARRQDQMLASMHSTAVQGAWTTNRDAMSVYETKGHYYFDHTAVCDLWAGEFGRDKLTCRIYERDKLVNSDIVDDFSTLIGLELDEERDGVASNESLSFETMCVLLLLNGSRHKDNKELRRKLMATGKKRNGKRIPMVTRDAAKAFLSKFSESNRTFFSRYIDPSLATDFTQDFVAFPEVVPPPPGADTLLDFVFSGKP